MNYKVSRLPDDEGWPVYEVLSRSNGNVYHVKGTAFGSECDCADFIFRREHNDPLGCKHIQALEWCGMLRRGEKA